MYVHYKHSVLLHVYIHIYKYVCVCGKYSRAKILFFNIIYMTIFYDASSSYHYHLINALCCDLRPRA